MKKNLIALTIIVLMLIFSCAPSDNFDTGGNTTPQVALNSGDSKTFTFNTSPATTFKMIYVQGKTFPIGCADIGEATVFNNYWIAETETTFQLWHNVCDWTTDKNNMGNNFYTFQNLGLKGNNGIGDVSQPVTTITWRDAMVWCNALTEYTNAKTGSSYTCAYYADPSYMLPIRSSYSPTPTTIDTTPGQLDNPYVKGNATGFRLLSNNEWELAARYIKDADNNGNILSAGEFYPGNYASGAADIYSNVTESAKVAIFGVSQTSVVGNVDNINKRKPNALGIYDMSGNVWEICFDWYPGYVGTNLSVGAIRSVRGGSYTEAASVGYLQVGLIWYVNPFDVWYHVGFRIAKGE
jgi:formylglycine-generating enzyme